MGSATGSSKLLAVSLAIWWTLSVLVVLALKAIFTSSFLDFPYPFFVSGMINVFAVFMVSCFLCFFPDITQSNKGATPKLTSGDWAQVLTIGIVNGLDLGASNYFLKLLPVATRQMASSVSPMFMLLVAVLFKLERLTWSLVCILLSIAIGGLVSNLDLIENGPFVLHPLFLLLFFAILSFSAVRWSCSQRLLQSPRTQALSPLRLFLYSSPSTAAVMLTLSLFIEGTVVPPGGNVVLWTMITAVALGICIMTVAEYQLVKLTSALSISVFGCVHNFLIVLGGIMAFHDRVTVVSIVGYAVNQFGVAAYAYVRRAAVAERDKREALLGNANERALC